MLAVSVNSCGWMFRMQARWSQQRTCLCPTTTHCSLMRWGVTSWCWAHNNRPCSRLVQAPHPHSPWPCWTKVLRATCKHTHTHCSDRYSLTELLATQTAACKHTAPTESRCISGWTGAGHICNVVSVRTRVLCSPVCNGASNDDVFTRYKML